MDDFLTWKDFNNIAVEIELNSKIFFGILIVDVKNNILKLKIDMTNDLDEWRNTEKDFNILKAKFVHKACDLTLINCISNGHSSTGVEPIINASSYFIVDRILLGYSINNTEDKFINKCSVIYDNIDCFIKERPYKVDYMPYKIGLNPTSINLNFLNIILNFNFNASIAEGDTQVKIIRKNEIYFSYSSNKKLYEVISDFYKIKNILMLLLKKNVIVKKQIIILENVKFELFDCSDEINFFDNDIELNSILYHRSIKIEDIPNFEEVMNRCGNIYDRLYPLIELYFNVIKFKIPNLTRFVSSLTMLEYYSREFDNQNALNLTITRKPKKKIKDAEFGDRVNSLITNVNDIYNFSKEDIKNISSKIKAARTYFVHYVSNGIKLNDDELFHFIYFIEDIILLNIYKQIKIDIIKFPYISFNDFYYSKNNFV